ncbi:MAG: hypothetical protein QXM96_00765, partial [Candidatus Woesearchaeota archaeon]
MEQKIIFYDLLADFLKTRIDFDNELTLKIDKLIHEIENNIDIKYTDVFDDKFPEFAILSWNLFCKHDVSEPTDNIILFIQKYLHDLYEGDFKEDLIEIVNNFVDKNFVIDNKLDIFAVSLEELENLKVPIFLKDKIYLIKKQYEEEQQKAIEEVAEQKEVGKPTEQKEVGKPTEQKEVGKPTEQKEVGKPTEQKEVGKPTEQKDKEN